MSVYDRLINRRRPAWVTLIISALLILAPIVAISLDGLWGEAISQGYWRPLLLPAAVIIYILTIAPIMDHAETAVLGSFRQLVRISDEQLNHLVREASYIHPINELVAFGAGAGIGLWLSRSWLKDVHTPGLGLYIPVSLGLMMGLLGWTIFCSIAATRLISELHRQPLKIDILNTKPFEPIGRQGLVIALAFLGGILLSMVFGLDFENLGTWKTWLVYIPLASVTVILFFIHMRHTQKALAAEKKRELQAVEAKLQLIYQDIRRCIAENESLGPLAAEFSALVTYEARLRAARTWPYNTYMLRTLFFTILIPILMEWVITQLF